MPRDTEPRLSPMAAEVPDIPRTGLGWKFWLRIVVSGALLAVLITKALNLGDVLPDGHRELTVLLLAATVVTTFLGVVLSSWRWQRVLCVFDVYVPLPRLL